MSRQGWKNESYEHSLAARGLVTKGTIRQKVTDRKDVAKIKILSRKYKQVEFIADLDLEKEDIVISDVQVGTESESFLDFDKNDVYKIVGWTHRHPSTVYATFSITDYALTAAQTEKFPFTNIYWTGDLAYTDEKGFLNFKECVLHQI